MSSSTRNFEDLLVDCTWCRKQIVVEVLKLSCEGLKSRWGHVVAKPPRVMGLLHDVSWSCMSFWDVYFIWEVVEMCSQNIKNLVGEKIDEFWSWIGDMSDFTCKWTWNAVSHCDGDDDHWNAARLLCDTGSALTTRAFKNRRLVVVAGHSFRTGDLAAIRREICKRKTHGDDERGNLHLSLLRYGFEVALVITRKIGGTIV